MSSSRLALIALVAVNLVPVVGVVAFGWSLFDIMVLYWLENGIVGLFTILRILVSAPAGASIAEGQGQKILRIPFFVVHYGLFWAVHGAFVVFLFSGRGPFGGGLFGRGGRVFGPSAFGGTSLGSDRFVSPFEVPSFAVDLALSEPGFGLVVLSMIASHGVSFVTNYLGRGEYRRLGAQELMFQPYNRVIVLHVALLFGGFAVMLLGAPILALLLLVALKTGFDVRAHLAEHQPPPTPSSSAPPSPSAP